MILSRRRWRSVSLFHGRHFEMSQSHGHGDKLLNERVPVCCLQCQRPPCCHCCCAGQFEHTWNHIFHSSSSFTGRHRWIPSVTVTARVSSMTTRCCLLFRLTTEVESPVRSSLRWMVYYHRWNTTSIFSHCEFQINHCGKSEYSLFILLFLCLFKWNV